VLEKDKAMNQIKAYVQDSWEELRYKVTWPGYKQVQSSSILVLVATFIIAGIIYGMDSIFGNIMGIVYNDIFN